MGDDATAEAGPDLPNAEAKLGYGGHYSGGYTFSARGSPETSSGWYPASGKRQPSGRGLILSLPIEGKEEDPLKGEEGFLHYRVTCAFKKEKDEEATFLPRKNIRERGEGTCVFWGGRSYSSGRWGIERGAVLITFSKEEGGAGREPLSWKVHALLSRSVGRFRGGLASTLARGKDAQALLGLLKEGYWEGS